MSESLDIDEGDAQPAQPKAAPASAAKKQVSTPYLNGKAAGPELYFVSGLMVDMADLPRAAHLPMEAFEDPEARVIFGAFRSGLNWPTDLFEIERLTHVPRARLIEVSMLLPTSAQTMTYLNEVESAWRIRRLKRLGAEMARAEITDPEHWSARFAELLPQKLEADAEGFGAYDLPPDGDSSVLLGDRYLNRGDGLVISGQSGMGKSSLSRQMMACWALGRPFHGIKSNGILRSLEIQAEDSRGDIGETRLSIEAGLKLTDAEKKEVHDRVHIVTERVRRGPAFMNRLARLIRKHKPDLVWINPLQAFIEGDVTEARDIGDFLRAGLNGLNGDTPTFAYVLVHHTTKPATQGDRKERLWHEEMYGMAGGAEIINWARGIIVLKATADPGDFNLVLAKRGVRAGVTRQVAQGAGHRDEPVTSVPLQWSTDTLEVKGRTKPLKSLFWQSRAPSAEEAAKIGKKVGAPRVYSFADFKAAFPKTEDVACGFRRVHGIAKDIKPIGVSAFYNVIKDAVEDNLLGTYNDDRGRPRYWLKVP
jgi:hypothetical protein